jgi:hypothetical protein
VEVSTQPQPARTTCSSRPAADQFSVPLGQGVNGGTGHQLGDWLAATLPNFYGQNAATNLAGQTNAVVAALFQTDFLVKGVKLDAQVLATALSVYVTNTTLDSTGLGTKDP